MDHFSDVECDPVIPCNPDAVSDCFLPYLVTPISIMGFLVGTQAMPFTSESFDLKIIDFGNCEFRQASVKKSMAHVANNQLSVIRKQSRRPIPQFPSALLR